MEFVWKTVRTLYGKAVWGPSGRSCEDCVMEGAYRQVLLVYTCGSEGLLHWIRSGESLYLGRLMAVTGRAGATRGKDSRVPLLVY